MGEYIGELGKKYGEHEIEGEGEQQDSAETSENPLEEANHVETQPEQAIETVGEESGDDFESYAGQLGEKYGSEGSDGGREGEKEQDELGIEGVGDNPANGEEALELEEGGEELEKNTDPVDEASTGNSDDLDSGTAAAGDQPSAVAEAEAQDTKPAGDDVEEKEDSSVEQETTQVEDSEQSATQESVPESSENQSGDEQPQQVPDQLEVEGDATDNSQTAGLEGEDARESGEKTNVASEDSDAKEEVLDSDEGEQPPEVQADTAQGSQPTEDAEAVALKEEPDADNQSVNHTGQVVSEAEADSNPEDSSTVQPQSGNGEELNNGIVPQPPDGVEDALDSSQIPGQGGSGEGVDTIGGEPGLGHSGSDTQDSKSVGDGDLGDRFESHVEEAENVAVPTNQPDKEKDDPGEAGETPEAMTAIGLNPGQEASNPDTGSEQPSDGQTGAAGSLQSTESGQAISETKLSHEVEEAISEGQQAAMPVSIPTIEGAEAAESRAPMPEEGLGEPEVGGSRQTKNAEGLERQQAETGLNQEGVSKPPEKSSEATGADELGQVVVRPDVKEQAQDAITTQVKVEQEGIVPKAENDLATVPQPTEVAPLGFSEANAQAGKAESPPANPQLEQNVALVIQEPGRVPAGERTNLDPKPIESPRSRLEQWDSQVATSLEASKTMEAASGQQTAANAKASENFGGSTSDKSAPADGLERAEQPLAVIPLKAYEYQIAGREPNVRFDIRSENFQRRVGVDFEDGKVYEIQGRIGDVCEFSKTHLEKEGNHVIILVPSGHRDEVRSGERYDVSIDRVEEKRTFAVESHGDRAIISFQPSILKSLGLDLERAVESRVLEFDVVELSKPSNGTKRLFTNLEPHDRSARLSVTGLGAKKGDLFEVEAAGTYSKERFVKEFNESGDTKRARLLTEGPELSLEIDGRRFPMTEVRLGTHALQVNLSAIMEPVQREMRFWFDGEHFVPKIGDCRVVRFSASDYELKIVHEVSGHGMSASRFNTPTENAMPMIHEPLDVESIRRNLAVLPRPLQMEGKYDFRAPNQLLDYTKAWLQADNCGQRAQRKGTLSEELVSSVLEQSGWSLARKHPSAENGEELGCNKPGFDRVMRWNASGELFPFEIRWWQYVDGASSSAYSDVQRRLSAGAQEERRVGAYLGILDWTPNTHRGTVHVRRAPARS